MSAANKNNEDIIRELSDAVKQLSLENKEMKEFVEAKFDGFELKITKELKQILVLEKRDYVNFMDFYTYWIALKRILISHGFEDYVASVEKRDASFKMTVDREDNVIEIIRRSVSTKFHPIIDANLIVSRIDQLSATQIMLLIKDQVVGNEPKQEELMKAISNLKLNSSNIYIPSK